MRDVLPLLAASCAPFVEDGQICRWQLDTYVREVERYGGDDSMVLAERWFGVDSECVLALLPSVPGDTGLAWRWKLALCGVDLLLDALGFTLEQRRDWVRQQRDAFATEFHVDSRMKRQLVTSTAPSGRVWMICSTWRTGRLLPIPYARLRDALDAALANRLPDVQIVTAGGPGVPALAASYAHMHINRSLRSAHRFQELALYELLDRIYRSRLAQATHA